MESDPFALVEAMAIAAFATGCEQGFIYIRAEYPLAHERLRNAIDASRPHLDGLDIELRIGAGAYVCGEETALFQSIEGYRGEPRNKPPFPVEVGLFGKPTVVNNVETLVNVLEVLRDGGAAYARTGTEGRPGRGSSASPAASRGPGLYELPFGATLRELLELAGAAPPKAVLLGGAAGAFVGPDQLDLPLTFEDTRAAGATLGSGVVIVFDEHGGPRRGAAADRRVLPRRVVRPVRAVPRRHRAPGGGAAAARRRRAARPTSARRSPSSRR